MDKKLENALVAVEATYGELVQIANDITGPIFAPITNIISSLNTNLGTMSIDQIRDYILRLQLKAFEISDIKEKSALKAELADALQKEKFAISFNSMDGTAAAKDKLALIETSGEVVAETLYNLVASLFKTKLNQCHRMIDCLKTILVGRMQETKFMNLGSTNEISGPIGQNYRPKEGE